MSRDESSFVAGGAGVAGSGAAPGGGEPGSAPGGGPGASAPAVSAVTVTGPERAAPVVSGQCLVLLAYDIGFSIDLERAQRAVTEQTQRLFLPQRRRSPKFFAFDPPPLTVHQRSLPLSIGGWQTGEQVECTLYQFGALSVSYRLSVSGPLSDLPRLGMLLQDNELLLADSRRRVEELMRVLGPAVARPQLAEAVEDYVIFQLTEFGGEAGLARLLSEHETLLAQTLRAEPGALSAQEIRDALGARLGFGPGDAALIDFLGAVLLDPDADDLRAVLEYANVELLEMRVLDDRLDSVLDRLHQAVHRRPGRDWFPMLASAAELRRLGALQTDAALMFEGVNNALKLIGDQYLARVYRLASSRLHLPDWDASILRKLGIAESLYDKIADFRSTRRMEILEWIIIVLIAVSIVLPFVGFGGK